MSRAVSNHDGGPITLPRFLSFADHAIYLAHVAMGQQAVIQVLWRYSRPVNLDMLARFRDNLAQGRLARLIRPPLLPFGRPIWIDAPSPPGALAVADPPLPPAAMQAWVDAQVAVPLDPARGPAWTFAVQTFTDGSTIASLVVSHCIADGLTTVQAMSEAVRGDRRSPGYAAPSVLPARLAAATPVAELRRLAGDAPATLRALAQLVRGTGTLRKASRAPAVSSPAAIAGDQTVVFPSAFVRVPASAWDARARRLDADRFTLLAVVTAAFAAAIGRVRDDVVTLRIPVNQRESRSRGGGNVVALATVKLRLDECRGPLHALQARLRAALLLTRREPNRLAALLPLVPFVPRRAFSAATDLALGTLADLPVSCSNVGTLPADVLRIDGGMADRFCFRGIDRPVARSAIEARGGVATVFAGVIPGFVTLSFVAYQAGVVTETRHLRALVERILADHELTGEFFDA